METARSSWHLVLAALLPVLGLAALGAAVSSDPSAHEDVWLVVPVTTVIVVSGAVGWLILRSHPQHPIGWLLCTHALFVGTIMSTPSRDPGAAALVWGQLSLGSWVLLYLCLVLVGYLFPDGRFLSRRWRHWVELCMAGYVAFAIGASSSTEDFQAMFPGHEPPLGSLPSPWADVLGLGGLALVAASLVGTVVCARQRLRASSGDDRLRMLWFSAAAVSIPAMLLTCWADYALTGTTGAITVAGISVWGSVIPLCIGIAILRTRLFDIELVLSRALTYGALTAGVMATYALTLWLAGLVVDRRTTAGLVAVAVVAVAVQPAHGFARRRIERWVYGDRSDPGAAVRRLAERVESADPSGILESVTASVAHALRVDRVWVELVRDNPDPHPGDRIVRVPLAHRGQRLGDLAVDLPPGRDLTGADTTLLHDLARHAGVLVRALQLTQDLQSSRAALVTAREEERRRLRRDLHDGVGPSLAAIIIKLNAAQAQTNAADRDVILAETRDEARAAIAEVRRLVDDLRPPAIDEVGLLGAIRQRAAAVSRSGLVVEVTGPETLPPLPAAVEVAAFRIAAEAITNVARHAGASACHVELVLDGSLELTVSDNGTGTAHATGSGVGWTSMTERAGELGGSCTISTRSSGGLVVRAVLPLVPDSRTTAEEAR
jgi:signal transduction histidine kinase